MQRARTDENKFSYETVRTVYEGRKREGNRNYNTETSVLVSDLGRRDSTQRAPVANEKKKRGMVKLMFNYRYYVPFTKF